MGGGMKKGSAVAIILSVMMLLLHTNMCRAASPMKNNGTGGCHEGLRECLVAEVVESEELLMDSEISRLLFDAYSKVTKGTQDKNHQAVPCGAGVPYGVCLPNENRKPHPEPCGQFKRAGC